MPPLSMTALRDRFTPKAVLPKAVTEQQNHWRARWGMRPKSPGPGEDWRYYFNPSKLQEDDPNDPRQRLRYAILKGQRETKYFLTGSKGSGKSTTAYALWDDPEVNKHYTVLGFTVHDYLNLAETDAGQLIAVMIAHLVEALRDASQDAKLGDLAAKATIKDLNAILREVRQGAKLEQVNVSVFGWFTAIFKESASARAKFRNYVDGQFDEIMEVFDDLNGLLEDRTGKKTLFVIDDLDKLSSGELARTVFHVQLPMLLRPRCAALYSYPLEVEHDPELDSLKRGQPNRYVLANVKLAETVDGPMLAEGREVMTQLVLHRLDGKQLEDAIDLRPSEWDRALRYTAGNFRELSLLLYHSFEIADMLHEPRANRRCFEKALERVRSGYNPLVQRYGGFLSTVREQSRAHELDPDLLGGLIAAFAVVEYPNEPGWLGVHPVVADLLDGRSSRLGD